MLWRSRCLSGAPRARCPCREPRAGSSSAPELGVPCVLPLCTAAGRAHLQLTNTIYTNGRCRLSPLVAIKVLPPSSRRTAIGFHSRTSLRAPTDRQLLRADTGGTPTPGRVQRRGGAAGRGALLGTGREGRALLHGYPRTKTKLLRAALGGEPRLASILSGSEEREGG